MTPCPWCGAPNATDRYHFCAACGHRADVPKEACDCPECWRSSSQRTGEPPAAKLGVDVGLVRPYQPEPERPEAGPTVGT